MPPSQGAVPRYAKAAAKVAPLRPKHPDRVAAKFRLIGDPTRLAILDELGRGECCVCDLVDVLGVPQPLLSHHLRVLREAELVTDRKSGRWIYYRLIPKALNDLSETLAALSAPKSRKRRDCAT